MEKYIGIDLGSSALKISLMNQQTEIVYSAEWIYDYLRPQKGWSEIDPDCWFNLMIKGLKKLLEVNGISEISGIGITGQMHTIAFLDRNGQSIRPAIMWNDTRTKDLIPNIKKELITDNDAKHIAKIVSTGSPLANLLWLRENEKANYQKLVKFLTAKDYLVYRLTGKFSTDYCDASASSLYDLNRLEWSRFIKKRWGFTNSLYPQINESSKVVGTLTEQIKRMLGISQEIAVVAGTGDNVASVIASGCIAEQTPLISLGTSGVVVLPSRNRELKETGKNILVSIKNQKPFIITQGVVQSGASCNTWWMEKILNSDEFEDEQNLIEQEKLGSNDVLFIPHLSGEKTLYGNPDLRGAFSGINLETDRTDLYQAVLEGVGYGLKMVLKEMCSQDFPKVIKITGGGTKSNLWLYIIANILNVRLEKTGNSAGAVRGAALLALLGCDHTQSLSSISQKVDNTAQSIQPINEISKKYDRHFFNYRQLASLINMFNGGAKNESV